MKKKKALGAYPRRGGRETSAPQSQRIDQLEGDVRALDMRLRTLIVWMAQSANSPISVNDAKRLINEIGRP